MISILLALGFKVGDCIQWKDLDFDQSSVKKITRILDDKFYYCYMPDCDGDNWAQIKHLEMYRKVDCK